MTAKDKESRPIEAIDDTPGWGEEHEGHFGYRDDSDRVKRRGLEDWELVEKASQTSDHRIPYWFFALFIVLLAVATGLTFPFWGVRPGFERPWFDWGIVAGAGWVVIMGAVIYYFVDYRHRDRDKGAPDNEKDGR